MKVSLSYHFYQKMPSHLFSRPFSRESYQSNVLPELCYHLIFFAGKMLTVFISAAEHCALMNFETIKTVCQHMMIAEKYFR